MQIIAFGFYEMDDLAEIVDALELVRGTDPRRFRRIERYVKRIVLGDFKSLAFYTPIGCICGLTKIGPTPQPHGLAIYGYGALIIHEATHGLLYKLRFAPSRKNIRRIEKIAIKEEARFLAKFAEVRGKVSWCFGYGNRMRRLPST